MAKLILPETDRLLFRQWSKDDYPAFAKINADPVVMQHFPNTLHEVESNRLADKIAALIAHRGWGFWAVEIKHAEKFIGFVGLHKPDAKLPFTPCVEIGWRLGKAHWGKGYATEAAKAALNVAFKQLNLPEVYSFTSVSNIRSRAVMERLGMADTQRNFEHPNVPEGHHLREHVLYKLTKVEWEKVASTNKRQGGL
jgi:RimJ/RimL family protein N-acetyltransferase